MAAVCAPAVPPGRAWRLRRLPVVERQRQGRRAARLTGKQRSLERDRQAIAYHYDTSNDFFASFLDPDLVYTCACSETPGDSLAQAQKQKLDLVCRKLRLQPGQRLLDIGCGWGQLLIHAAQEYGVEAVGITTSAKQLDWVDEKIRRLGLEKRCRIEFRDYRQLVAGASRKVLLIVDRLPGHKTPEVEAGGRRTGTGSRCSTCRHLARS